MENELITVVIPIFNSSLFLSDCVKSIQNQTYRNLEIILIDGGSTDGSRTICQELSKKDSRIKLIFEEKNRGQSISRNTGITIGRGSFFLFIDSDDIAAPTMIEKMLTNITLFQADISEVAYRVCENDCPKEAFTSHGKRKFYPDGSYFRIFLKKALRNKTNSIPVFNKLYRKDVFSKSIFPEKPFSEDFYLNAMLLSKKCSLVFDTSVQYCYFMRPQSATHRPLTLNSLFHVTYSYEIYRYCQENHFSRRICRLAFDRYLKMLLGVYSKYCCFGGDSPDVEKEMKNSLSLLRKNYWRFLFSKNRFRFKAALSLLLCCPKFYAFLMKKIAGGEK